jgi:hypothetical protein
MDRYEQTHTLLTIALHGGLYLAIIMVRYEWRHTALTIDLNGGLYLAIIIYRYERPPHCPYNSLAWRPLFTDDNGLI